MRIDEYNIGATLGQITRILIEKDLQGFLDGKYDKEFTKLLEKSLVMKAVALKSLAEHPVLGPMLDAKLKY